MQSKQRLIGQRPMVSMTVLMALLCVPVIAAASTTVLRPAPAPGTVQGPPDGGIAPGPPVRVQPITPTPTPTPVPILPAPVPAPPAQPTENRPRPAVERPRPASDRPAAAPERPAPAAPTTVDTANDGNAPADPAADAPAPPTPDELPADSLTADETIGAAFPGWLPLTLLGGLAVIGFGLWLWLRRRRLAAVERHDAELADAARAAAPPIAPRPAPATSKPVTGKLATKKRAAADAPVPDVPPFPVPTPAPAAPVRPAVHADRITLSVEPLAASTTLINLRLRYAVTAHNAGDSDAELTSHAAAIFTGSGAQEAMLRAWFAAAPSVGDALAIVPAGGTVRIERDVTVPLGQVNAMQAGGRLVLLPVLALALSYRHATGLGSVARAFVVGKAGDAGGKLAPLQLDKGMGGFGPLEARDSGIGTSA